MSIVLEGITTSYKSRLAKYLAESLELEIITPKEDKIGIDAYAEYCKLQPYQLWERWFPSEWVWSKTHAINCPLTTHELISLAVKLCSLKGMLIIITPTENEIISDFYNRTIRTRRPLRELLLANKAYKELCKSDLIEDFQARGLTVIILETWAITKTHRALTQLYNSIQSGKY